MQIKAVRWGNLGRLSNITHFITFEATKLDSSGHSFGTVCIKCPLSAGRVCYWDLVDERLVESVQAHSGVVTGIALHPKGECLLTTSTDGTIKVWR